MTPEQIEAIARGISQSNGGPGWWAYALIILAAGIAAFLGTYLGEKGKNLATKEDVEAVTDKVEAIKGQHQATLESLKQVYQFGMLAAEHRLRAHQEGFAHWRRLVAATSLERDGMQETITSAQAWWEDNCFYLGPKSREAFNSAYVIVHLMRGRFQGELDENMRKAWDKLMTVGDILLEEVELPALSPEARRPVAVKPAEGNPQ